MFSLSILPALCIVRFFLTPMYCSLIRNRLQIMASSLNGLSVGDSLPDNIMESPARSETASCFRSVCSHLIYINYKQFIHFFEETTNNLYINYKQFINDCLCMHTPPCIAVLSCSKLETWKWQDENKLQSSISQYRPLILVLFNCFSRNESFKIYFSSETSCEMTDETVLVFHLF